METGNADDEPADRAPLTRPELCMFLGCKTGDAGKPGKATRFMVASSRLTRDAKKPTKFVVGTCDAHEQEMGRVRMAPGFSIGASMSPVPQVPKADAK